MATRIYKHHLKIVSEQVIEIRSGRVLKFAEKENELYAWAEDTSINPPLRFSVALVGTGEKLPDGVLFDYRYCDTVVMSSNLVWHIFIKEV